MMPKYSEEFKEQLRELRDAYLDGWEDKTDARYIELMAQAAEDDAKAGRTPAHTPAHASHRTQAST